MVRCPKQTISAISAPTTTPLSKMILEVQGSVTVLYFAIVRKFTTSNPRLLAILAPNVGSFANDEALRNDKGAQGK